MWQKEAMNFRPLTKRAGRYAIEYRDVKYATCVYFSRTGHPLVVLVQRPRDKCRWTGVVVRSSCQPTRPTVWPPAQSDLSPPGVAAVRLLEHWSPRYHEITDIRHRIGVQCWIAISWVVTYSLCRFFLFISEIGLTLMRSITCCHQNPLFYTLLFSLVRISKIVFKLNLVAVDERSPVLWGTSSQYHRPVDRCALMDPASMKRPGDDWQRWCARIIRDSWWTKQFTITTTTDYDTLCRTWRSFRMTWEIIDLATRSVFFRGRMIILFPTFLCNASDYSLSMKYVVSNWESSDRGGYEALKSHLYLTFYE